MYISRSELSPNFDMRKCDISALVLHYTGMEDFASAFSRLCDSGVASPVSAHYVIDVRGCIFGLVEERHRAWHAGVSSWRGRNDINDLSIGIELVNKGHEFGYHHFSAAQMSSLLWLSRRIVAEYGISNAWILGHSDIAFARKLDPGELFDWGYLARGGVGFVPCLATDGGAGGCDDEVMLGASDCALVLDELLHRIGYACTGKNMVAAFQRRYRQSKIDNVADFECVSLARALLAGLGE